MSVPVTDQEEDNASTNHTTAGKNKWLLDELDLGKTCANAPGMRGVYLAEVRSDEIQPDRGRELTVVRLRRSR